MGQRNKKQPAPLSPASREKIKNELLEKFKAISLEKPLGIDFGGIDITKIYAELQLSQNAKDRLNRFGKIFQQLEGLKQFNSVYYKQNREILPDLVDAIIYNELIQLQVFIEFFQKIKDEFGDAEELYKLVGVFNTQKMNKIRNAIAHFDWEVKNELIVFRDSNYQEEFNYFEISSLCSAFSMIGIFLTNDIL